ncbi:D-alanyl-D-alanine carboxypeptidase family protein [Brockia lithotrophica]|uniref:serine-type D-Ala-D-Ala carboxypeptidase n=1 Tax=Brockia lithotrophica TaxID=933949 RepID=A0A660KTL5_9BACL|nr:D-alanyl-D-alanine carboxypeptidase family protein [Brockia lithotrophica]RKQ83921.1 D-alanyl-D-alanine carboxypeptidase (penicillin-binding protein 5/6) [Brockia lithotrophica]
MHKPRSLRSALRRLARPLILIGAALGILLGQHPAWAEGTSPSGTDPLRLGVRSAILVELESGRVLYAYNAEEPLPPASMTKMMTEYLVLKAVREGKLRWEDPVTIGVYPGFLGRDKGSRVFLEEGETRTVRELFTAMAVYSANDATAALAEKVAGSREAFVSLMNETAKSLGMVHTHFVTCHGYPEEELAPFVKANGDKNVMSARDAAILARHLLLDTPEILSFTSIVRANFPPGANRKQEIAMENWNKLLPGLRFAYEGADGLKTGFTDEAKYCVTATAKRGDMRLIAVVMGAEPAPGPEPDKNRFLAAHALFNYGFQNFARKVLAPAGQPVGDVSVRRGTKDNVPAVPAADIVDVVPVGHEEDVRVTWTSVPDLFAPVQKGQKVGELRVESPYPLLEGTPDIPLVAGEDVPKAPWWRIFFAAVGDFFANAYRLALSVLNRA